MNTRERPGGVALAPLQLEHLDAVLAIERATFARPWSRQAFLHELLEPQSHFSCLLLDGVCIGYGGYWHVVDEMHISNLAIAGPHQRRGYGSWLVAALLREAAGRGMAKATLEVREHNAPAKALYRRFDFTVAGRRPGYYAAEREDALIMWNHDLGATVAGLPPHLGVPPAG